MCFGKSPKVLRAVLTDVIEDAGNELSSTARLVVQRAFEHWREVDEHMRWCDRQIGQHVRSNPAAQRAAKIIGIGELGASGLTASVGDFRQFKNGHQFGAWLGHRHLDLLTAATQCDRETIEREAAQNAWLPHAR